LRVFVISKRGEPLMPCSQRKARLLLKKGKASIAKYNPFTIQLGYATGEAKQEVNTGIDTGAKYIGAAITSEDKVLWQGEIELRDGISDLLKVRSALRKNRRARKTRYRQARFLNRKKPDGWLPPSVQSKLDATLMWIDKFQKLVPNPKLHIEVGKFDIAKIINPDINGRDYQNGPMAHYENLRAYVFARDGHVCQVCKKRKPLQAHHIVYRSFGGTDRADNLISVCCDCHTSENHNVGGVLYKWMLDGKRLKTYREATFMNIIRKRTMERYPRAEFSYGYDTAIKRHELGLSKTHYNDAIAISGISKMHYQPTAYCYYKQFRKKKRSLHESIPRKGRSRKNTSAVRSNKNVKYRSGICLNDKVSCFGQVGWVYGFACGVAGKECVVRNISGTIIKTVGRKNSISIATKNLRVFCHNNNWNYCVIAS
jgi:hypothetical protein